ncbi:MAG: GNAT family N-acetyltransferase [Parvularcula sp.]|jgi:GNAT superfamily N-acetyltransferase|nr:GNAT family N-acetyltransferase [Parvularcula sp.]
MMVVRMMTRGDVPEALRLMKALAAFEGYLSDFRVTESDLLRHGFGRDRRFTALVAAMDGETRLSGIAVLIEDAWNYQMRPTFVLKELFVDKGSRGSGVGAALFAGAVAHCREEGAVRLRWIVLADNKPAFDFYHAQGGRASDEWALWELGL